MITILITKEAYHKVNVVILIVQLYQTVSIHLFSISLYLAWESNPAYFVTMPTVKEYVLRDSRCEL